jgi:ribosomal protein S18 acetylase RimI-like enzyme
MIIRTATINDAAPISQLVTESAEQFFAHDFTPEGLAKFKADFSAAKVREKLNSAEFAYYVAEIDGEIIAVCSIRNGSHLYNLFTRADYHCQGVARALWQQVAHELKRDGVSKVTVNASNYAVPAYEKLGFVRVGEMKVFEGIPFNPMVNELSR